MFFDNDWNRGGAVFIDRVELEGFKSFARRTTVHLGPGISGVVGPNGCGKSNIVDAIKWCLGEQSAKALRGQNMGDVIFNGSETEKPADYVEVSLIFNRGESYFKGVFEGLDEVQVTRKLTRNGQSTYLLNQSKVRLKDVQLFFMDTGLYNQRYALIEQGQIGHIVEARPNQMRLLFEEAAGISHFNERRVAAQTKLKSTQENLDKVQIIVDGLKKQLFSLERQAKKAVQYQRTRSVLRQLTLSISVSKYLEWAEERSVLTGQEKEILATEDELEHVNRRQWSMWTQAKQSLSAKQDQSNQFQKELQTLTQHHTKQQTTLTFQRKQVEDLEERRLVVEGSLHGVTDELETISFNQTSLNEEVLIAEERMKEASQQRSLAIDAHNSATRSVGDTDKEINSVKDTMDTARAQISKMEGELVAIAQRLKDIQLDEQNRAKDEEQVQYRLQTLVDEKSGAENLLSSLIKKLSDKERTERSHRTLLEQQTQNLQRVQQESRNIKNREQTALRKVEKSKMLIQSTKRMIEGNQGVSNNSKSLLKEPEVLGLMLSMLIVPKDSEQLLLTLLGEDADIILLTPKANTAQLQNMAKGRQGLFQLPKDWESQWQRMASSIEKWLGPLNEIDGPLHAKYALCCLLGEYDREAPRLYWKSVSVSPLVVERNGVRLVGVPASIASELLHRRRTLVAEEQRLTGLEKDLSIEKGALQVVREKVTTSKEALQRTEEGLQSIQFELRQLKEDEKRVNRRVETLTHDIDSVKEQQQTIVKRSATVTNEQRQKQQKRQQLNDQIAALHQKISKLDTELRFSQEQRSQQVQHAGECSRRRNEWNNQCTLLGERLIQTKQRRDGLVQNKATLLKRKQHLETEIASIGQKHTDLLQSNRNLAKIVLEFEQKRTEVQSEVDATIASVKQLMTYADKMETAVQQTQKEKDDVTTQRVALQKKLDAVHSQLTLLKHEVVKQYQIRLAGLVDRLNKDRQLVLQPLDGVLTLPPQNEVEAEMSRAMYCAAEDFQSEQQREDWERRSEILSDKLSRFGQINFAAAEEITGVESEYESMMSQKMDLENSIQQIEDTIAQLNELCTERFLETVQAVNDSFQVLYPRLVGGGSSSIKMVEPNEPLSTGISIFAQPPGKKLERLSLLSGGERAMVAIALLFSLFQVKPSPVCLMDEVDAPLDEANGERFNTMLKEMSTQSQFIVITHNKKTMEVVDTVYGVTMPTPGVSQLVSVKFQ